MSNDDAESLVERIAAMTDRSPEQVEHDLEAIAQRDEGTAPAEWPTLAPGELILVKGVWFEVVGIRGGMLYLKPRGPSAALVKRMSQKR